MTPHEHIARVRIGFDTSTGLSRETLVSELHDPKGTATTPSPMAN